MLKNLKAHKLKAMNTLVKYKTVTDINFLANRKRVFAHIY